MHIKKEYSRGFAAFLLLGITSCSLPTGYDASIERDVEATIQYKEEAKTPQTPSDTDVIRVKDDIWLGDTSEIEYEGDKPLPSALETSEGVTLVSNRPITLYEIGNMISQITSIKMRFAPQLEGSMKAAADRNAPNISKVGSKWSDSSRMLVSYKGPLSGLLDEVTAYFGVWWKYEHGEIYIYKYTTKTFTLYTLPTKPSMTSNVSSSSGGGSISNGLSVDLWVNILSAAKSMLAPGSYLDADPSNGTLTITATPTEIKKVAQFINEQNIRLSRQVAISVKVLQVEIDETHGFGFDLDLAFKDRTERGGKMSITGVKLPSGLPDETSSSLSMRILGGDVSAKAAIEALATQGTTTLVTSGTVTTMNNKPAPIQVVKTQKYISEFTKTNNGSTSGGDPSYDISTETEEIETGFTLDVLPRIMDHGRLMLLFSLNLSDLLSLDNVVINQETGEYIQNPIIEERGFSQEIALKSGDTLVLSGYERVDTKELKEGLGSVNNTLLGGSQRISKGRTIVVILLTPVVLESPLLPESRMKF